jgi:hypothetical protein
VVEVHSEIHYVPLGEGWEEVVVRNVLHYVPIAAIAAMVSSVARWWQEFTAIFSKSQGLSISPIF